MKKKCSEKSAKLRSEGNKLYAEKKFFDALIKYNESLCYVEPGSENLGFAYANRSAVYFEVKLYSKCLNNIQLARSHNYPEKNFEVLKKREEKCIEFIKHQVARDADPIEFFKLSYPANNKVPFIANCLEVKTNEKYGRHIVTNQSLKVGDVVAIEEPFCRVINGNFIHQRCANCLKDNMLDLIPVPESCSCESD